MPKRGRAEVERLAGLVEATDQDLSTVAGVVHQAIRQDIISLKLAPGAALRIHELRRRYEAGATPLREALCTLVGEGLVESTPQHGFRVAQATREDLRSLTLLRHEIEPQALRLSIEQGGADWLAEVAACYHGFQQVSSLVGDERPIDRLWEMRHRAFHMSLIGACGLWPLLRTIAGWYDLGDRYRRLASPNRGATAGTNADHDSLYKAVCVRDIESAVALLRRHVEDNAERYLTAFDAPADA